jgi:hypothetical protein
MVNKKKKSRDDKRRIVIYAPSVELKQAFERLAAKKDRTASNYGWHLFFAALRAEMEEVKPKAA